MKLLDWLSSHDLGGTGTIRQNRVQAMPHPDKKKVEKNYKRGEATTYYTGPVGDSCVTVWKDNKPVYVGSNVHKPDTLTNVTRWNRAQKKEIVVPMPDLIKEYNSCMGGVDLLDEMVSLYRPRIRKRKWWWCFYTWALGVMVVNSWRLWQKVKVNSTDKADKMQLLEFTRHIVVELLKTHGTPRDRPGPSQRMHGPSRESVRADGINHWIIHTETKGVCGQCTNRSFYRCEKCNVALHANCFKTWHMA